VVGRRVARRPEVAGIAFRELARQSVEVHGMTTGAGHHSLKFLVERSRTRQVVSALYDALVGFRVPSRLPIPA
jgi:aspartokinase